MPLMERLSSETFRTELNQLYRKSLNVNTDVPEATEPAKARTCRCGCGEAVGPSRHFVSQAHQVVWLRTQRYFGVNHNLQGGAADAAEGASKA
ncbi:hypothetical protein FAIPA1_690004 [Frankia sp. AiPs1]